MYKNKNKIWNVNNYIMDMQRERANLKEEDLKNVSGGKINRKFLAGTLTGLSFLMTVPTYIPVRAAETDTQSKVSESVKESAKKMDVNRTLSKEEAVQDINFVLDIIKKYHVSAVEKLPDEVVNQKEIEINNLSEKITIIDEWRAICRIISKLHDAHTMMYVPEFLDTRLPFSTACENDKFICTEGQFNGYEVAKINDITIEDLYKEFKLHYSYEIDEWPHHAFFENPRSCIPAWKLALAGIDTSKPLKITFKKGEDIKNTEISPVKIEWSNMPAEPWVSYNIDKENKIGIFKLDKCTYNGEYTQKVKDFFTQVDKNNIKNIIVDLRSNYGGNSQVVDYFFGFLKNVNPDKMKLFKADVRDDDKILHFSDIGASFDNSTLEMRKTFPLYDGKIFVLTSHGTFSSGMWFASVFSDNDFAKIIGEIPGNSPTSFGDCTGSYTTPNGKLQFHSTWKRFYRPNDSKSPDKLVPDIQVCADKAMDKAYEVIRSAK